MEPTARSRRLSAKAHRLSLRSTHGSRAKRRKHRGRSPFMPEACGHLDTIRDVTPSALGCEECLKTGSPWVHLRICRTCGHVACCDSSPNKHATKHFHRTKHPLIEGSTP